MSEIVARNYADALLELAQRNGGDETIAAFGAAADDLAALLASEPRIREFLATPRVGADERKAVLQRALSGRVPELFLRFVLVVVEKRRQALLGHIARAYAARVDELMGRARVAVTISHPPDAELQEEIRRGLEARLGRTVIATFHVDPELIGGIVVRMGDQVLDGSIRSRTQQLRRRLLEAQIPAGAA